MKIHVYAHSSAVYKLVTFYHSIAFNGYCVISVSHESHKVIIPFTAWLLFCISINGGNIKCPLL